jgi:hypothetical protein
MVSTLTTLSFSLLFFGHLFSVTFFISFSLLLLSHCFLSFKLTGLSKVFCVPFLFLNFLHPPPPCLGLFKMRQNAVQAFKLQECVSSTKNQCCRSGFIESGSRSGSIISSEYGSDSGARSRVFDDQKLEKIQLEKKNFIIKNCNLLIPRTPQRTSKLQQKPSALVENIKHLKYEI